MVIAMKTLLGYFWQGCILLVPVVATLYVAYLVVATLDRLVPVGLPGLGFALALVLITFVGFMSSNVIGRAVMGWAERSVTALPFVRLVYTSIRDLVQAFVGDKKGFDRPVLVTLAPGGPRVVGFLTRDGLDPLGLPGHVAVYIPQSYNFAGNLVIVPREQVEPLTAKSPEVLAFIVSGGVSGFGSVPALGPPPPPPKSSRLKTLVGMGPRSRP